MGRLASLCLWLWVASAQILVQAAPETTAAAEECSAASFAAADHKEHTLRVLAHRPPVMGEPVARHAAEFSNLTGMQIEVRHAPFDELYEEVMLPFLLREHRYDVLFYGSLWIADVAPFLAPVPEHFLARAQMQEVTQTYRQIATWRGRVIQYPVDGDRHYFKYRRSAFANPEYQRRFLEQTGQPLRVPRTWDEYATVARFFNGWDWDGDGEPEYGAAEVTSTADMMVFSAFISRAAAYAKHPKVPGGFYFDLTSMTPLVNTPGWVRALENFIEAIKYMPPGGDDFTIADEIESYGSGQAMFSNSWDDATARAAEPDSPIRADLGFDLPMGSHQVWNRLKGEWDRFEQPNRVPYIAWGWTAGVSRASPNTELAFEFLCFFKNRENHDFDLSQGRSGVNPHRRRDFDPDFYVQRMGWPRQQAEAYTRTLKAVDQAPQRVLDLRVPGGNLLMESMVRGIHAAKTGILTPQEALDQVALEWREIVAEIGHETVRRAYADVVAIEDGQGGRSSGD